MPDPVVADVTRSGAAVQWGPSCAWSVPVKVVLDRKKCLRSGQCTYLHPKVFKEGAGGYPEALETGDLSPAMEKEAEDAADICPAGAIDLV
jgi:ferredoxin